MNEEILLTQAGFDKLTEELEYLKTVRRLEVSEHLKTARSYGDLSENAEYDAAKNEQVEVEERIQKLEYMTRNAKIVSDEELTGTHVNLGLHVTIKDVNSGEADTYEIVGVTDADPFENKISNESPIGKGLLGKMVGDIVDIQTEIGIRTFEVVNIEKK